MIIAEKFIMINFPKTGSTFVRNVISELYAKSNFFDDLLISLRFKKKQKIVNLLLPNIRVNSVTHGVNDEHGLFIQIPEEQKNKEIISIKRDLFERYISAYEYGNWKNHPWIDEGILKSRYSNYPDLSFKEYIDLVHFYNPYNTNLKIKNKLEIGHATCQFILYNIKEPHKILNNMSFDYSNSDDYKKDMAEVTFLNQNNLNVELYDYLISKGYNEHNLEFILNKEKQNNSTPKDKGIFDYFDDELLELTKERDKLLFKIFGEYSV
jgi:hypothetical protein